MRMVGGDGEGNVFGTGTAIVTERAGQGIEQCAIAPVNAHDLVRGVDRAGRLGRSGLWPARIGEGRHRQAKDWPGRWSSHATPIGNRLDHHVHHVAMKIGHIRGGACLLKCRVAIRLVGSPNSIDTRGTQREFPLSVSYCPYAGSGDAAFVSRQSNGTLP